MALQSLDRGPVDRNPSELVFKAACRALLFGVYANTRHRGCKSVLVDRGKLSGHESEPVREDLGHAGIEGF